jgi:hypothetical protein
MTTIAARLTADKTAMPNAMIGGRIIAPVAAAVAIVFLVSSSRRKR